jgi:hypothetical protein
MFFCSFVYTKKHQEERNLIYHVVVEKKSHQLIVVAL